MATYQYIGTEYTMIRLKDGEEKVKVTQGEIIDTDRFTEKQMLRNGFQITTEEVIPEVVVEDTPEVIKEVETPKTEKKKSK